MFVVSKDKRAIRKNSVYLERHATGKGFREQAMERFMKVE